MTIGVAPTSMLLEHLALAIELDPITRWICPTQSCAVRNSGGIGLADWGFIGLLRLFRDGGQGTLGIDHEKDLQKKLVVEIGGRDTR